MSLSDALSASFRDPSGFIFERGGTLYRQVNASYEADYNRLKESGLYQELVADDLLIPTEEVDLAQFDAPEAVAVLKPLRVPTISYPYEWSFSQLKDSALLTLQIATRAVKRGMILKDASTYNVQFLQGRPIFIDTLSFEIREPETPWIAYRQFCQHFLAPLALMSKVDVRLGQLMRLQIDGIPLDLAAKLLPGATKFNPGLLAHLHVHGKKVNKPAEEGTSVKVKISDTGMLALLDNLESTIKGLKWQPEGTEWGDYYSDTNYTDQSMISKKELVSSFLASLEPAPLTCWDLGANTGEFSRLAADRGIDTVAWDVDPAAVEKAYLKVKEKAQLHLLPLLQDLTNPSPAQGWAHKERDGLAGRGPVDVVMALALVHHLAIGNNVPLRSVLTYFAELGQAVIIEFVPKADSQVRRLLASRKDIFENYTEEGFEAAMNGIFKIARKENIPGTSRTLYLLTK